MEMNRASNMALVLAKSDVDRRLTEMNNLREQINQERGNYVLRTELNGLNKEIQALQKFVSMCTGGLIILQVLGTILLHYWHGP